jgi:hypothetical protein
MKKFMLVLLILLFATVSYAGSVVVIDEEPGDYCCNTELIDVNDFATDNQIDNVREDMTRMSAISTAMASLELDPTRDGFSMGVALGVADFANGSDEIGEAVGIMYGRDNKAINVKYGRSGSYSAAGVGLTVGF